MAHLSPIPLSRLVAQVFRELERDGTVFGLPLRRFVLGSPLHDTSVRIHGRRVSSPLGPSAGPHTQMAQNIVLCWLAGARVFELKTVQVLDHLRIPRPCIDARTVGYNVEWSQELTLEESLDEYVKASMLIEMLAASGAIALDPSFRDHLFDMSVGYDFAGIRGERMKAFMRGLIDAGPAIDRLRSEIPAPWARFRDLDFSRCVSDSVTLSTFHGCPVAEIEQIADFLLSEIGIDCAIKLNPTLLGVRRLHEILHDRLGYTDIIVPPTAFENDPSWDDAAAIVASLQARAASLGRSFAVKLTNTLVVENHSDFLPQSERVAYLSGAPLHVLAMHLVRDFRRAFGYALPLSFSAGIDRVNYADAVSLGLAPVTVCTDLLKQGGYGRLQAYASELLRRMDAAGARTIDGFIVNAEDGDGAAPGEAILRNTERYVATLDASVRYHRRAPLPRRSTGRALELFDCATCDLCIPACPNGANIGLPSLEGRIEDAQLVRTSEGWHPVPIGIVHLRKSHQIATVAELCNDCGNCETFCPDDGAPNRLKVRLFATEQTWRDGAPLDGFTVAADTVLGRVSGVEYSIRRSADASIYSGSTFRVVVPDGPRRYEVEESADAVSRIDLWPFALMDYVRRATLDPSHVNPINCTSVEGDL